MSRDHLPLCCIEDLQGCIDNILAQSYIRSPEDKPGLIVEAIEYGVRRACDEMAETLREMKVWDVEKEYLWKLEEK